MNDTQPVVYVVQERRRLDIRAAEEYGKVVLVLPEPEQMYDMDSATRRIFQKMHRFTERDYVLAIGHPVAIAVAITVACRLNGGRCKVLVWDKNLVQYTSSQVDVSSLPLETGLRL